LEYAIWRVQDNQEGQIEWDTQLLAHADDVNIMEENTDTMKKTQKLY
jgi:hypothetical protein